MDFILLIGQSNAKGCGNPEKSVVPGENVFEYVENFTGNALIPLSVTLQLSEGRGTLAPALANTLHQLTGEEICIVHYAVDGSRIKNWNHDKWLYLDEAMAKFQHAVLYMKGKKKIGKKIALWIQGESDAKYGTDPLYYQRQLKGIAQRLKEECSIEKTFVSQTGYWQGDEDYLKRSERIAAIQEETCQEDENLMLISKTPLSFLSRKLLQDDVHYSMEALNLLGTEIAENINLYYNNKKIVLSDSVDLSNAKQVIKKLKELMR